MSAVYTFGETVYDIIFENEQPVAARAGGAMLNTAVSLGRCQQNVSLITEMGDDRVGRYILSFLEENMVRTEHIFPYPGFKTPVALAFLDENKSASYSFYKKYPGQRLEQEFPKIQANDVVLFGSFYSLNPEIRAKLAGFLNMAKEKGAVIIYDPNIRKNHLDELGGAFPYVMENIALADIVRGSEEDFFHLFHCMDQDKISSQVREMGCHRMILTKGEKGAELFNDDWHISVKAKKIQAVSTIGAGDSFNAGVIYGLTDMFHKGKNFGELDDKDWQEILKHGTEFAANACSGYDNYISREFAGNLKK